MRKTIWVALSLIFAAAPSLAGWHGSEWGMNFDQVAVSGVPAFYPLTTEETKWNSNEFDGTAEFGFKMLMKETQGYLLFKEKRLSAVRINIGDLKLVGILKKDLLKRHGKPFFRQEHKLGFGACQDESLVWHDEAHNNNISLYRHWCKDGSLRSWIIYRSLH